MQAGEVNILKTFHMAPHTREATQNRQQFWKQDRTSPTVKGDITLGLPFPGGPARPCPQLSAEGRGALPSALAFLPRMGMVWEASGRQGLGLGPRGIALLTLETLFAGRTPLGFD